MTQEDVAKYTFEVYDRITPYDKVTVSVRSYEFSVAREKALDMGERVLKDILGEVHSDELTAELEEVEVSV